MQLYMFKQPTPSILAGMKKCKALWLLKQQSNNTSSPFVIKIDSIAEHVGLLT
jgi:hypothetical protein